MYLSQIGQSWGLPSLFKSDGYELRILGPCYIGGCLRRILGPFYIGGCLRRTVRGSESSRAEPSSRVEPSRAVSISVDPCRSLWVPVGSPVGVPIHRANDHIRHLAEQSRGGAVLLRDHRREPPLRRIPCCVVSLSSLLFRVKGIIIVSMRAMHWSLLIGARRGPGCLTKKNGELQNVSLFSANSGEVSHFGRQ